MIEATFETTSGAQTFQYFKVASRPYDLLYVLPEYDANLQNIGVGLSRPAFREYEDGKANPAFGFPATVKFGEVAGVALSSDGITYDLPPYKLLKERFKLQRPEWADDLITQKLNSYLRDGVCYTDNTDGWAWAQIVTCGNVLYPTGNKKNMGGESHYEVRQLQVDTLDKMKQKLAEWPYLETWSTISCRGYEEREVRPFPFLNGVSVPALLFCKTATNWIKASRVRMLDRDEPIPDLYYP